MFPVTYMHYKDINIVILRKIYPDLKEAILLQKKQWNYLAFESQSCFYFKKVQTFSWKNEKRCYLNVSDLKTKRKGKNIILYLTEVQLFKQVTFFKLLSATL